MKKKTRAAESELYRTPSVVFECQIESETTSQVGDFGGTKPTKLFTISGSDLPRYKDIIGANGQAYNFEDNLGYEPDDNDLSDVPPPDYTSCPPSTVPSSRASEVSVTVVQQPSSGPP